MDALEGNPQQSVRSEASRVLPMSNASLAADEPADLPESAGPSIPKMLFTELWTAWAVLLVGALLIGTWSGHGTHLATWGRMGSSLMLVLAAYAAARVAKHSAAAFYCWGIAIGMALGTLGDFFNAGLLQEIIPLSDPVLGGIAAFGLGHIAYMAACVSAARRARLTSPMAWIGSIAVWQAIGVVSWYFVVYLGTNESARPLVWPSLPYSLLLAGTAGVATALAVQERRFTILAVGAALFLASDMILAIGLFRGNFAHQTVAVWSAYGSGQMMIVFSTLAAIRVLTGGRR
jgi:uncharacterized membrane protein YhhN